MEKLFADRSARAKLRFTGPQRAWFLHQVLTQAFEDIVPGDARDAAMITPHGRMIGYLEVLATEEALLAHFEPELREVLPEALARYVFATEVVLEDVTDQLGLVLAVGESLPILDGRETLVHPTSALGVPAAYLWTRRDEVPAVERALEDRGARRAGEEELEAIRVASGAPRWGRDMTHKTLPQEAGVDALAVHYDKGCYLGQEAMAKIHFRGRVNRALRRLELRGGARPGDDVWSGDDNVGRLTSVADGRALALLRRSVEPGAIVRAGSAHATVLD